MPRNGATLVSDLAGPKFGIECSRCPLRRRYDLTALKRKTGDLPIWQVMERLAAAEGCDRLAETDMHKRCRVQLDAETASGLVS